MHLFKKVAGKKANISAPPPPPNTQTGKPSTPSSSSPVTSTPEKLASSAEPTNAAAGVSAQDLQKMPKPPEVNARFEKVLKYRGIAPTDKRYKALMGKPLEDKWKIVVYHERSMTEQENSFKIKEAPEFYIHCIKENPSRENLLELSRMLRTKPEEWIIKYLSLEGLASLFEVLVQSSEQQADDRRRKADLQRIKEDEEKRFLAEKAKEKAKAKKEKKEEEEEPAADEEEEDDDSAEKEGSSSDSKVEKKKEEEDIFDVQQSECIKAIRTLMNTQAGMKAFLASDKSVKMVARVLDSENVKTKTQIFFLLSTVCMYSEDGFWLTLDSINQYKLLKQEENRFTNIIQSLKQGGSSEDWILYKIACMMFINTLVNAPQDTAARKQLKKEFKELGLLSICEELKNGEDIDETLLVQLGVFEEEMDELEEEDQEEEAKQVDMGSLENPIEILKLIRVQLSGSSAFEHFVNILQYFLIISGKSSDNEKTENMSLLENIVKKAINMNESGAIENISVKELQLSDRVANQQKKIYDLEDKLAKLSALIKNGKMDQKMIEQFASSVSIKEKMTNINMEDPELTKAVMEETKNLLEKMKPPSASELMENDNKVPEEYKSHVKNLENEIKFLNYKLKNAEKKAKEADSKPRPAGASSSSGSAPSAPAPPSGIPTPPSEMPPPPPPSIAPPAPGAPPGMSLPPPPPPPAPLAPGAPPAPPAPPGMGPPPPPMPPGMGPPPPPMPPGMGPPPPPGMPGAFARPGMTALPPLPNIKASVPMKGIFWSNVAPTKLKDSIWLKGGLVTELQEIKLDIDELQALFQQKKTEAKEIEKKKVVEKVVLIDPKKAQNASIVLGSMRMPNKEIKKAILNMDEQKLSLESIKALKDLAPTADELGAVRDYQGDPSLLGPTEQFFKEIMDVPRFEQRLTAWMFKMKFDSIISTVEPDVESMTRANKELMESKRFAKLLSVVLAIGNFLNSGRKGAHGFQLSALIKLRDTKATGAKLDLLEYVISYVEKNFPDVLDFVEDLANVEAAQRVVVQSLQTEINELKTGLNQVGTEIDLADMAREKEDKFRSTMIDFIGYANEKVEEIDANFEVMNKKITELQVFFAEDEKKFKIEPFLAEMNEFIKSWKSTYGEMVRKREQERQKREREEKKLKEQQEKASVSSPIKTSAPSELRIKKTVMKKSSGEGLLDASLDSLADGSAFKKKRAASKMKSGNIDMDDVLQNLQKKEGKSTKKKATPSSKKGKEDDVD